MVEEFLDGEEASFFALVDGEAAVPLASAQDHKAAGDGDTGPNTGVANMNSCNVPLHTMSLTCNTMRYIICYTMHIT